MIHFQTTAMVAFTERGRYDITSECCSAGCWDVYFTAALKGWPHSERIRLADDGEDWPDLPSALGCVERHAAQFSAQAVANDVRKVG